MIDDPLLALAAITSVAVLCQWVGAQLKIPSVLFLLIAGVALSPVLDPDEIFGELLFTGVGIGVAILLFEGGTGLTWRNLQRGRATVIRLITVGALVSWVVGTVAALLFLDVKPEIAVLMAAILIVSGPTVVMPLLRVVRPREPTGSILRWEGILIDPVGAGLAIVVLDAIISERSWLRILVRVATTFGAGLLVGAIIAGFVVWALSRHLINDHLHIPVTLAAIIGADGVANALRPEAGLVAVTLLGMAFANQRFVSAHHIAEFNENLGASVLGVLFVVLGARVEISDIVANLPASAGISAALILIARPLTVLSSTLGTNLANRDRWFLMSLAPRGVVAAAVASLFALELEHEGIDPGPMVPVTFTVVMLTVAVAGTTARFWARRFKVARPEARGVALIGGGQFGFDLADALVGLGVSTLHVGLSDDELTTAAEHGQLAYRGRLDSSDFDETVDAVGIGYAVALSGTDHLDAYATQRLSDLCGSANLYGLAIIEDGEAATRIGPSKTLLPAYINAQRLRQLTDAGASVRVITESTEAEAEWLTICAIDAEGNINFDGATGLLDEGEKLVQLGPIPAAFAQVDPLPL